MRFLLAAALVLLAVYVVSAQSVRDRDVPERVIVLTSGTVTAADHEVQDGYYTIGHLTLMVPPDGIPAMRLREALGQKGELIWRPFSKQ